MSYSENLFIQLFQFDQFSFLSFISWVIDASDLKINLSEFFLELLLSPLLLKYIWVFSLCFLFDLDLTIEFDSSWCSQNFSSSSLFLLQNSFLCFDFFFSDQSWSSLSFNQNFILFLFLSPIDSLLHKFVFSLLKLSIFGSLVPSELLFFSKTIDITPFSGFELSSLCNSLNL